jgi:arylsulfatase A-like enzyme
VTDERSESESPPVASRFGWLLSVVCHPVLAGGALGAFLAFRGLVSAIFDSRYGGVSAPTVHRFLATVYRGEFVRVALVILSLGTLVGLALGLLGALLVSARARWLGKPRPTTLGRLVRVLAFVLVAACLVWLDDVASRPGLYQEMLYGEGGWRRTLQVVVSDVLGRTGVGVMAVGLFCGWVLWPVRRGGELRRRVGELGLALGGLSLSLVVGFLVSHVLGSQKKLPVSEPGKPNVLLVASDSLRADRIDEARAPNLTELSRRSVTFERAYTTLPRTFPAWVSLLSGQEPAHHGIRHMFPRWETRARHFDTLAGRLDKGGWHTAVVGDFAADIFRRIDLGYSRIDTPIFTMRELLRENLLSQNPFVLSWLRGGLAQWLVPALAEMHVATDSDRVTSLALSQIDEARGRPFFVTAFYSTTHFPYASPGADERRFRVDGYRGPFRYAKADTLAGDGKLGQVDIAQIRALYDAAVYATDRSIGELLEGLARRGLAENTIVVVTADHGEQLYEQGRSQGHGDHLLGDESLRVPLIVYDPRGSTGAGGSRTAHRVSGPVSLVDLAPTLLEMTGQAPLDAADGRSLFGAIRHQPLPSRPVYVETGLWFTETIDDVAPSRRIEYPDLSSITEVDRAHGDQVVIRQGMEALCVAAKHRMVQDESFRLVYEPTRTAARFSLFDMNADPGCQRDVAAEHPAEVERLKEELWSRIARDPLVERFGDWVVPRQSAVPEAAPRSAGDGLPKEATP